MRELDGGKDDVHLSPYSRADERVGCARDTRRHPRLLLRLASTARVYGSHLLSLSDVGIEIPEGVQHCLFSVSLSIWASRKSVKNPIVPGPDLNRSVHSRVAIPDFRDDPFSPTPIPDWTGESQRTAEIRRAHTVGLPPGTRITGTFGVGGITAAGDAF